jgi:hypothetical protein
VVIVPSGFAHVDDVSERIDSTSTRLPCARADTAADTTSGLDNTGATFGGGSTAGTAVAGSCASSADASNAVDTNPATSLGHSRTRARLERSKTDKAVSPTHPRRPQNTGDGRVAELTSDRYIE